jgi:IS30 family transposase
LELLKKSAEKVFLKKVYRLKYSINGFNKLLNPHHKIFKSLTLDNGGEKVRHQKLDITTYFCHPYSAWEKGAIENSFKRLRRFIPKGKLIENYRPKQIKQLLIL